MGGKSDKEENKDESGFGRAPNLHALAR